MSLPLCRPLPWRVFVRGCLALGALSGPALAAAEAPLSEERFAGEIRPILQEYCLKCHSTEKQKGDLDLEVFTTLDAVKRHPRIWQSVAEQMENGEMPPKAKPQPPDEMRAQLTRWTGAVLESVARERAGDPGPVVLRRLSNAEYTYTLRDLTGVESLDPAREFPTDGAAGEGFTNTGQALTMSPALLAKYLDAAKSVAAHAILLPDGGIRFSAGTTRRDWTDELVGKIRALYGRYAGEQAGAQVNLQGIKFETNAGGGLPLARYVEALAENRAKLEGAAGREVGAYESNESKRIGEEEGVSGVGAALAKIADGQPGVSAKYLGQLWAVLGKANADDPLEPVFSTWRERFWQAGSPAEAASALTAEVARWQKAVWKFNTVGHLGVPGHPTQWMEPVDPMMARQDFRVKLPAAARPEQPVTVYLRVRLSGAGAVAPERAAVVWERPRIVEKGKPDSLLSDLATTATWQEGAAPAEGEKVDATSVAVPGASLLTVQIPASVATVGAEFVVTARAAKEAGEGGFHAEVLTAIPTSAVSPDALPELPVLTAADSATASSLRAQFARFREFFPAALCYAKIVPTDEVITSVLFHREDEPLCRLMLDDAQRAELDQLWAELRFVSQEALTRVDVLSQIIEYATQDSDPKPFMALREEFASRAARFREQQLAGEPKHLESVLQFAGRAYRRPLTPGEGEQLRALYARLRAKDELPHEEAIRLTLARVLTAPQFLYRGEEPGPGVTPAPVTAPELASRLSYFLWSSQPDATLREDAASGALLEPATLHAQTQRMLGDARIRRLALEFGCQWLHLRDFESLDEKSEKTFPTFATLRGAMLEETVQTFTDLFQHDGSVLSLLDGDRAFLNEALAAHYGIPGVRGPEWRAVAGVRTYGRGWLLAQAAVLSRQAGASRTSPILRGDFIAETLLGEKIPRPPKDVPPFPEDAAAGDTLTVRQITEKHTADVRCASCHRRFDPFGFALEEFDGIGRRRGRDAGGHVLETRVTLPDGAEIAGLDGLRSYLLGPRRDAFVHQFCRKLLGFALGRGVQLSDEPLLAEMQAQLATHEYDVSAAIETIVQSRPFRDIRGREMKVED